MSKRKLVINNTVINDTSDCYVIAEIGHNHKGSVEICKDMFQKAKECGVNAVKLQKRDNKQLFTMEMLEKPYHSENAYGHTYGEHREALEFGDREYKELSIFAKELGLDFFSTAFDFNSADFLNELDVPAFKLASGDLKSVPLLKYVASFGKPIIISTGGAKMEDVRRAYQAIMPINPQLAILQCSAAYPAPYEVLNLNCIKTFRDEFSDITIGLSSHDNGISAPIVAYTLGARIVEKHFTLDRTWKGTDHKFSLEPQGLQKMCRDLKRTRIALGDGIKRTYEQEVQPLIKMGKKIVAAKTLQKGHILSRDDLTIKSPGDGVQPYHLEDFIGKELKSSINIDQSMSFEHV